MKNEVTIFERCAGLNTINQFSAKVDYKTGTCELRYCDGIALTSQGKIKAEPTPEVLAPADGTVISLSGFNRFILQIGTGIYVWRDSKYNRVLFEGAPLEVVGNVSFLHTHLDIRFVSDGVLYVLPNSSFEVTVAAVGTYAGPETSVVYNKMPTVSNGFTYNGRVYVCDGEFLRYSEKWYYDCWDYGNGYIPVLDTILEGKAINNVVCVLCSGKVVILMGSGPQDFAYQEYEVTPIRNSLASGYSDKLGNILMFLATDGIYVVDSKGSLANITRGKIESIDVACKGAMIRNDECYQAVTSAGVYTYDFDNAAFYTNKETALIGITKVRKAYLAATATGICRYDRPDRADIEFHLPLLDFGEAKRKKIRKLKFYGKFLGALVGIVNGDERGNVSSVTCTKERDVIELTGFGTAVSKYLDTQIVFAGAKFELERITATVYPIA